jgi:trimethylamine--corrinoid protein Co-methyltransferase
MTVAETVARPPIAPLRRDFTLTWHTSAQLDRLKQASLDILESVGVRFPSATALDILAGHGCGVDRDSQVVTFPPDLVLAAMARAPRYFDLGARDPACAFSLSDDTTWCTTDGCGVEIVDLDTGVKRLSTKADLARVTRITDYLSSIAFWWPIISAGDCGETAQLHELDAGWNNTVKHLQGFVQGGREARYAVEMATVIAGGAAELRRRPVLSDLIGTISPLVQDEHGIEAALVFAEAGVPVTFVTMPTLGTTAPATRAGAFAVGAAELVSATVLVQLAFPGAPVAHSIMQSYADPRTGGFVSFPLDGRCRFLATELAHHWGVPSEAACCGTDAKTPGTWQAGVEDAMDLVQAAWEGSDLMPSIGLLDVYTVFDAADIVLGDDVYHRARYAITDLDLGDEALALDAVREVGPGGHYLGTKHTRRHLRTSFVPAITHQPGPDGHFRDPLEVARERAVWIDANYRPEPLELEKATELSRILATADTELR